MQKEILASLEAVLFACGGPVEKERLADVLQLEYGELDEAIELLKQRYECDEYGLQLIKLESSYQLCTKPMVADCVKKALQLRKVPPLSKASLEVLAIVAYNQPVTRLFVEQVRGVDSSNIISSLCDKGLLAERGTLDAPGRPMLFGTTDSFLRCFGLQSLSELPAVDFAAASENEQATIDSVIGDS